MQKGGEDVSYRDFEGGWRWFRTRGDWRRETKHDQIETARLGRPNPLARSLADSDATPPPTANLEFSNGCLQTPMRWLTQLLLPR